MDERRGSFIGRCVSVGRTDQVNPSESKELDAKAKEERRLRVELIKQSHQEKQRRKSSSLNEKLRTQVTHTNSFGTENTPPVVSSQTQPLPQTSALPPSTSKTTESQPQQQAQLRPQTGTITSSSVLKTPVTQPAQQQQKPQPTTTVTKAQTLTPPQASSHRPSLEEPGKAEQKFERRYSISKPEGGSPRPEAKSGTPTSPRRFPTEEKRTIVKRINEVLKDDPDLQAVIPINPDSMDIFEELRDGVLLW